MATRDAGGYTSNPFSLSHALVTLIRRGEATTRTELADRTGMGRSLIAQRVGELIDIGMVAEDGKAQSRGGRAPRSLRFVGESALVVGAALRTSHIELVITDLAGREVAEGTVDSQVSVGPIRSLENLAEGIRKLVSTLPEGHAPVIGVGVGLPGPVDFATGAMVVPPGLPDWNGYPFAQRLSDELKLNVWADNDVNVMAIGESALGHTRPHEDFIVVNVGTGVGAGVVLGGDLHRGIDGGAGDIGHVAYGSSQVPCICGRIGCLSATAGGMGISRRAHALAQAGEAPELLELEEQLGRPLVAEDVLRSASQGDPVAYRLIADAGNEVGRAIALLVGFANPSLIILAGKVSFSGDVFLNSVRTAIYEFAPALGSRHLEVRLSELGAKAGAIGAALMSVEQLMTPALLESRANEIAEVPVSA